MDALLKCKDWKKFRPKQRLQKYPNCQVMAFLARSPQTRIFWKSAKGAGDQGKFFKNRPKSSPPLKGPKALWRKWHYPLISMLLKCKDWKKFRPKQRLQKYPNCQVMAFLARSPQTRIFWKSAKGAGDQGKFFKNRPKSSPPLKGPKALWRKWHYPLISMLQKCKDWTRFWRIRRLQKCPNG